jgi:hypothetical protein
MDRGRVVGYFRIEMSDSLQWFLPIFWTHSGALFPGRFSDPGRPIRAAVR